LKTSDFLGFKSCPPRSSLTRTTRTSIHLNFEGLAKFLGFLVGFTGDNKVGPLNPLIATGTILVVSVIMAGIAYYFNHKLKVKNA